MVTCIPSARRKEKGISCTELRSPGGRSSLSLNHDEGEETIRDPKTFLTFNLRSSRRVQDQCRFSRTCRTRMIPISHSHTWESTSRLEMLFIELDVDSLGFALLRSTPHYPSKRTRLKVSLLVISIHYRKPGVEREDKKGETYTTEVHPQSGLQSRFPPWQIMTSLNALSEGAKDLFKRWSTIHRSRHQEGQWAISQLDLSS